MSLIGLLFLAIIGVYVWTFKVYQRTQASIARVYEIMNKDFVREKLYSEMHENLKTDVTEIKSDIKKLLMNRG